MGTDERGPLVATRGEMRVALTGRPPEEVWRPMVGRTAQLADGPGNSSESFDRHDLAYAEAADRFGLRDAADAVYAEAAVIWDSFDTPLPWNPPADLWDRTYDGTYHDMYYQDLRAFHAR